jgi:hypothetical protein
LLSSTAKRVVAYRFDRQPLEGFVNPATFLLPDGVELITMAGAVEVVPYAQLKAVCFVGEPGHFDLFQSDHFFTRRPRNPGLWTRFTLRDGDRIDGILPHNLSDWPRQGYMATPPRASAVRQKIFIPREAIQITELQGVIGLAKDKAKPGKQPAGQLKMFE